MFWSFLDRTQMFLLCPSAIMPYLELLLGAVFQSSDFYCRAAFRCLPLDILLATWCL